MPESFTQNSKSKDEEKVSTLSSFDEDVHSKKGGQLKNNRSPTLMTVQQIQDLVANAIKAQLGGDMHKTHLYNKPYAKSIDALYMPHGYQPLKFQ